MDNTFGPQVKFTSLPAGMKPNRSPKDGLQFFGSVRIEAKTRGMTVRLHNLSGEEIYKLSLLPER
jgi:alkaline phosphatase D